ncbi:MAG: MerR family transcriptional regulator [Lachnospiraceae bacterium]|nr:MerR family transcriptional regulator [Lachnospiraceae bacterium]
MNENALDIKQTKKDIDHNGLEYTLSVGQFSKLCNTTRDTLRHYYEEGILEPRVDDNNGYHYYSSAQISSFFLINTLRNNGCSINEIRDIVNSATKDTITTLANSKIAEMQKKLFRINMQISAMQMGMFILDKYDTHTPGSPFIDKLPLLHVSYTDVSDPRHAYHAADIATDISRHLAKAAKDETMQTFPSGSTIGYDDLLNQNYVYKQIFSLSFTPSHHGGTTPLPGGKAVLCSHDHNQQDIKKTYRKLVSFIKKNNLNPVSDLFSISLINLYDNAEKHTYFKYLFILAE